MAGARRRDELHRKAQRPGGGAVGRSGQLSSRSSSVGPPYQSRRSPRSTTMSPRSAEPGMHDERIEAQRRGEGSSSLRTRS
jgi:hypothetical protein